VEREKNQMRKRRVVVKEANQSREESLIVGNLSPNQLQKQVTLLLQLIVAVVEMIVAVVALHLLLQVQDLHKVEVVIVTLQKR
jgi:hypothetical protein